MTDLDMFRSLGLALAIGLLIGFEREWTRRREQRTRFVSGARTFAIVGLLGGLVGVLEPGIGWLAVAGFIAVSAVIVGGYTVEALKTEHVGATTEFALLATYLLGMLCAKDDYYPLAAAGAVAVAVLLNLKPNIQRWASALDEREIAAALQFLIISIVILPVLPNRDMGPYGALNPRQVWLMVVLISGFSFTGYILTRLFGTTRGVLLTGLVGGIASSTAATLSLASFSRGRPELRSAAVMGIILANLVMFGRIAVLLGIFAPIVLYQVWPVLTIATAVGLLTIILFRPKAPDQAAMPLMIENPLELRPALLFGAILALTLLASRFMSAQLGVYGLYAVGAASGLADVDAMTLSAARLASAGHVVPATAGGAALCAAAANIIVKAGLTWIRGDHGVAQAVSISFTVLLIVGTLGWIWFLR